MNRFFDISLGFLFDPLALFFIVVISLLSVPAFVYSWGYLAGAYPRSKIIGAQIITVLFVAAMLFVVSVRNIFVFLIAWELMSLLSYFLVIFDSNERKSLRAGTIYIVMTHLGTAFLAAAFFLIYKYCGSFDFLAAKASLASMPRPEKNLLFGLLFTGFAVKAGLVPMHIWLPYAHPAAPSHISALMSGVMIKTAIYGMLRFIVYILGIDSVWQGSLILIFAIVSSLAGVIYALMEHDIKRLLAYHSVENIGIILMGMGASLVFIKMGLIVPAVLAMSAGLYHLINHAAFKGLLFLCAGSVYKSCHTRDMEKLGGLIERMGFTAVCFLIGSAAISALPPLNGFVSEWLTFQAFFLGALSGNAGLKVFMAICVAALALTSGLAAACFVKAFGLTFLGLPRSQKPLAAKESPLSMKLGMGFLVALCLGLALACGAVLKALVKVSGCVLGIDVSNISLSLNNFILAPEPAKGIYLSPLAALVILSVFIGLTIAALRIFWGRTREKTGRTWDCGYYKLDSRNEYTATGFSKPFRLAFSFFLMPYRKTQKVRESFYLVRELRHHTYITSVFKKYLYRPLVAGAFKTSRMARRIQMGSIHIYIGYIFVTAIILVITMKRF